MNATTPAGESHVEPCYLCGSAATRFFLQADVHRLLQCGSCGLVYAQERHDGIGISADQAKFLREYLGEEKYFGEYFDRKLDLIECHSPPGTLMDFGCGAGLLLTRARARGWKVIGVEGSGPAAAHAKSSGLEVWEGAIESFSTDATFDVVTAFHTVEHFADPIEFMKGAHRLLKPGGFVVLTTPDRHSVLGRLLGKRWFGYYNDEHVFFYDERSLRATLLKAGFADVIVTTETGRVLSPSYVFTRLFDYYYRHPGFLLGLVVKMKGLAARLDFIRVREPGVNLVALGWKR